MDGAKRQLLRRRIHALSSLFDQWKLPPPDAMELLEQTLLRMHVQLLQIGIAGGEKESLENRSLSLRRLARMITAVADASASQLLSEGEVDGEEEGTDEATIEGGAEAGSASEAAAEAADGEAGTEDAEGRTADTDGDADRQQAIDEQTDAERDQRRAQAGRSSPRRRVVH